MSKINLLPINLKEEIEQSKKNKSIFFGFLIILVISLSLVVMIFYVKGVLNYRYQVTESSITEKEQSIQDLSDYEKKAQNLSSRIQRFKEIKESQIFWSKELNIIAESTPPNIYLMNIKSSDNAGARGMITGNAADKNAITTFMEALKGTGVFQNIDIESVAVVTDPYANRETNNFVISFVINLQKIK